jgi:hypothetical protein
MRLYHFTGLRALIGDAGLDAIQPGNVDLRTVAAPGSIIADGLKPFRKDDYDHVLRSPLPPCVWLTSDPDMVKDGLNFSSFADYRITVLIPSIDPRLVHWPKYFRKHGQCTWSEAMRQADVLEAVRRASATFYVYFGRIARITQITHSLVSAEEDHPEEAPIP